MVQEVGRHLCLSMGGTCGTSHGTADRGSSRTIDNCWNTTCARLLITPMSHSKHQWITNKPQWKARRTKRSRLPMSKNRSRKIYTSIRVKIKINSTSPWPAAGIVAVEMGVLTKISEYKRVSECQWSALSSKMVLHLAMPLVGMGRDPMYHMPYIASRYFTVEHVVHGVLAHAWPNLDEAPFWSWSLSLAIVHQAYHWPTIKPHKICITGRVKIGEIGEYIIWVAALHYKMLGRLPAPAGSGFRTNTTVPAAETRRTGLIHGPGPSHHYQVLNAIMSISTEILVGTWRDTLTKSRPSISALARPSPTSSLRRTSSFTRARGPPVLEINTLADHS